MVSSTGILVNNEAMSKLAINTFYIYVTVQKFLNEREGIFDDEGVHGDRSEEKDEEFGNLKRVVIDTG